MAKTSTKKKTAKKPSTKKVARPQSPTGNSLPNEITSQLKAGPEQQRVVGPLVH